MRPLALLFLNLFIFNTHLAAWIDYDSLLTQSHAGVSGIILEQKLQEPESDGQTRYLLKLHVHTTAKGGYWPATRPLTIAPRMQLSFVYSCDSLNDTLKRNSPWTLYLRHDSVNNTWELVHLNRRLSIESGSILWLRTDTTWFADWMDPDGGNGISTTTAKGRKTFYRDYSQKGVLIKTWTSKKRFALFRDHRTRHIHFYYDHNGKFYRYTRSRSLLDNDGTYHSITWTLWDRGPKLRRRSISL